MPQGGDGSGSGYSSVEGAVASGYPLAGAAALIERDGDAVLSCRVALTGVAGAPQRLDAVERLIVREGVGADVAAALDDLEIATDDVAYRKHLAAVVVGGAVALAHARAGERSVA